MKQKITVPKIIKIEKVAGFTVQCMFNNGESRLLNFSEIFKNWEVSKDDIEYPLLDVNEFSKVCLRNYTLSWSNVTIQLKNEIGEQMNLPYEIGADVLYELSKPIHKGSKFLYGKLIRNARRKAGLTQEQLANKIGTTRFYISRVENNKTDIEMSTFRKIIEAGLGKKLRFIIE